MVNADYLAKIERSTPLTPKEFLLFELELYGGWMNKSRLIWGNMAHLFKNRYQREKAINELLQDDLIAVAFPPMGKAYVTFIKFEPKELNL